MFTLAMIQMRVDFHQPEANLNRAAHLVAQAAADGAQLCILPECMDLGWGTPEALQLAQPIPGAVSQRLCQIARENGVWLVSGLTEKAGDRVYNAALLISDQCADRRGGRVRHRRPAVGCGYALWQDRH